MLTRIGILGITVCLIGWGCGSADEPVSAKTVDEQPAAADGSAEESALPAKQSDDQLQTIVNRTNKFLKAGNFRQAMDVISRAMVNHPESASLYRMRAVLHHKTEQSSSAMTDYSQAVQLDPDNAKLRDEVGFYLLSVGEIDAASKHLQQAVKLDPESALAWNHLGLTQITQGEFSTARETFSKAIELKDDYVDAFINRGFVAYRLKEFDKALKDYEAALAINPDAINAHNNKGLIDYEQEDYQSAVANFTKCIMIDPKNPKYYEHRRLAYLKLGMNAEASEDAKRWQGLRQEAVVNQQIARQPANAVGYIARGQLAYQAGRYKDALLDYDRAIQLNPNLPQGWFGRAKSRFELEEYALAVEDCSRVLSIKQLQPAYSLRGEAYLKLDKIDEALADFHAAKRLDPTVAEAFIRKAEELETLGQSDEAQEYRDKAKDLFPDLDLTPSAN